MWLLKAGRKAGEKALSSLMHTTANVEGLKAAAQLGG